MNEPFSEELLSAYLDEELSSSERDFVEAELAARPELRRLLEELQTVKREFQSLPFAGVDAAFTQRVLEAVRARTPGVNVALAADPEAQIEAMQRNRSLWTPSWSQWLLAGAAAVGFTAMVSQQWRGRHADLLAKAKEVREKTGRPDFQPQVLVAIPPEKRAPSEKTNETPAVPAHAIAKEESPEKTNDPPQLAETPKSTKGTNDAPEIGLVLSPQAWSEKSLDRLLTEHGIKLERPKTNPMSVTLPLNSEGQIIAGDGSGNAKVRVGSDSPGEEKSTLGGGTKMVVQANDGRPTAQKPQILELELSPEQWQALAAALEKQGDRAKLELPQDFSTEKTMRKIRISISVQATQPKPENESQPKNP